MKYTFFSLVLALLLVSPAFANNEKHHKNFIELCLEKIHHIHHPKPKPSETPTPTPSITTTPPITPSPTTSPSPTPKATPTVTPTSTPTPTATPVVTIATPTSQAKIEELPEAGANSMDFALLVAGIGTLGFVTLRLKKQ